MPRIMWCLLCNVGHYVKISNHNTLDMPWIFSDEIYVYYLVATFIYNSGHKFQFSIISKTHISMN